MTFKFITNAHKKNCNLNFIRPSGAQGSPRASPRTLVVVVAVMCTVVVFVAVPVVVVVVVVVIVEC